MAAAIASLGNLSVVSGVMARAVAPIGRTPTPDERPDPPTARHVVSSVAFAPAAMSALIEAQENVSQDAPQLARARTEAKIDRLIAILADGAQPLDGPLAVRQLSAARAALAMNPVDVRA